MKLGKPKRWNFEGDLEYNLYDQALQEALYSALLDYVIDADGSTGDVFAFAVSPLGWETFDRVLNDLWRSVVDMAAEDARDQLAELVRGVPEGFAA